MALIKTSPLKNSKKYLKLNSAFGFTMIEIMIVLAIMGMLLAFGASRMSSDDSKIKSSARRFAVMIKKIRNQAKIDGIPYRLVINIPEKPEDPNHVYWVESTTQNITLGKEFKEELKDEKGNLLDPYGFSVTNKIFKKNPQQLPKNLYFEKVELPSAQKGDLTSGRIYIHFFPEGRVEESAIHLTNRDKLKWTIQIHPITGRADIFDGDKRLEEIKSE